MANILQNLAGMGNMTEQVIASDFLLASKTGVLYYAIAVSEAATPEVRTVLKNHLNTALDTHEKILGFMVKKGYYHPADPYEQIRVDTTASQTVLNMQQ